MSQLKQHFLEAMSRMASTVNVVTSDGPAGRIGLTVSAMSSVSADTANPTLLICVNDSSPGAAIIAENGVFAVNVLADDQEAISDTFAGRFGHKGDARFGCGTWAVSTTGAPMLEGALASFDCRLVQDLCVGTHRVFFGEVQSVSLSEGRQVLLYSNRSYGTSMLLPAVERRLTRPTNATTA